MKGEESHEKTKAETGGMRPQGKGHLQPPEAGRKPGIDASLGPQRDQGALISDSWPPEL